MLEVRVSSLAAIALIIASVIMRLAFAKLLPEQQRRCPPADLDQIDPNELKELFVKVRLYYMMR